MKSYIYIGSLLASVAALASQVPVAYEYWIDSDTEASVTKPALGSSFSFDIDDASLSYGYHKFSYRLMDAGNNWGSPLNMLFYVPKDNTLTDTYSYEYWLDGDTENAVMKKLDGTEEEFDIDASSLSYGSHFLSYHLVNGYGEWGSPIRKYFYIGRDASLLNTYSYEYWLDGDTENAVMRKLGGTEAEFDFDASSLSYGGHFLSYRLVNGYGEWGSPLRKYFYILPPNFEKLRLPTAYRQSINNVIVDEGILEAGVEVFEDELPVEKYLGVGEVMSRTFTFADSIPTMNVSGGFTYSLQFRNINDDWGSPIISEFDLTDTYTDAPYEMTVPESHTFTKASAAQFRAVRFTVSEDSVLMTASQDCRLRLYRLHEGGNEADELGELTAESLWRGTWWRDNSGEELVGILYEMPVNDENPSEELTFSLQKYAAPQCETPIAGRYDGRYLTVLWEDGDSLHYTINGDNPLAYGIMHIDGMVDGKPYSVVDLKGLNTLRAVALREDYRVSEELTFTPQYYSDETDLYVTGPDQVAKAFEWCGGEPEAKTLAVHGSMGDSTDAAGNYQQLNAIESIRHLDLTEVTDSIMPSGALDNPRLVSVIMPEELTEVSAGDGYVFGNDNTTLCAVVMTGEREVPANLLNGLNNPNLLVYDGSARRTALPVEATGRVRNVIAGDRADRITLTHGYPYYAPREFTAGEISYSREFGKTTALDGFGSGWESMCVPFDVEEVRFGETVLQPFAANGRTGKPFWLYGGSGSGWERTADIRANEPYIIAMPNNPWYEDEYNIEGTVIFRAENVLVAASTDDDLHTGIGIGNTLHGNNYFTLSAEEDVLALNEEPVLWNNVSYQPGGLFAKGLRDVEPFECYVTSASGARYVKLFDASGIDDVLADGGLRVWAEGGELCLRSGIAMRVPVYDLDGRLLRVVRVPADETVRERGLAPGIYLAGSFKFKI